MRVWARARKTGLCGRCGKQYLRGDPVQMLTVGRTVKIRCRSCADGPVPDDVPEVDLVAPKVSKAVSALGLLPLDWRRRAAGDREPGEEG